MHKIAYEAILGLLCMCDLSIRKGRWVLKAQQGRRLRTVSEIMLSDTRGGGLGSAMR